jgi:DNA repair protein RadA/Sms
VLITEIWDQQPGKFFCISTKTGAGKWKDHFFSREEFGDIKQFLRDHDDEDIYFCPHGFNRRVRQKSEAVLPNLLWADLDFANPSKMKPKPTYALESSPGRYVGLWALKDTMNEELNRRLTYHVGADPGGWDLTQVLRYPGTRNYKYRAQPKVRTLWKDGPTYSTRSIEKHLPAVDPTQDGEYLSAAEVFENYQDKLPRWVRRELMNKKVVGRTDRSEMLWKLENACIEAGMTEDEAFAIIKNSSWNKFAGRRNEDKQLRAEITKIIENHFKAKPKGAHKLHPTRGEEEAEVNEENPGIFTFRPLSEIEEEQVDWIWYPYLAKKTLSILEGDPGLGKSYMAMIVAATIAKGERLPCVRKGKPKAHGPVVYFDIENNAASVTKVRLKYNGYDDLGNYYPVEQAFSIDDEDAIEEIYSYLEEIKPILVVFDTLNTYIGRADTHKASEATQAMNIFKQIANDFDCSVLVVRHLTKGTGAAMYRGQGSVAFAGSARVVMCVGVDPEDSETRVMAVVKGNLAPLPGGLGFRIEARPKDRSEFIWENFNQLTAQEVMDASTDARTKGKEGTGIQEAMEFLEATIKGVAVEVEKLYRMGEKRSIPKKMLDRAADRMDIKRRSKGKGSSKTQTWEIKEPDND